jgi:hypothetical protein
MTGRNKNGPAKGHRLNRNFGLLGHFPLEICNALISGNQHTPKNGLSAPARFIYQKSFRQPRMSARILQKLVTLFSGSVPGSN